MPSKRTSDAARTAAGNERFGRLDRPISLTAQVEALLRQAIAEGQFTGGRLPTEIQLAEQLGVSRETVRLAAEVLEQEGLLVKIRRKGTFLGARSLPGQIVAAPTKVLAYLQAGYQGSHGQTERVAPVSSGLMLQGALEEASAAGYRLVVQHAPHLQLGKAFDQLYRELRPEGIVFASYGEEKLLRRVLGLGLPVMLLDHDLHLPGMHSVREDSFQGAYTAVRYLIEQGHRRIMMANWHQVELNPWRLAGYRQGMRDGGIARRRAWELSVELTAAGARHAVKQLLALSPRPTAIYCFNNTFARFVLDELRARGLRVPAEFSVLGGGGEDVAGLTCHQTDWHALGRQAVEILLRAMKDRSRSAPQHLVMPHALREGTTTGTPD